jgi:hypothetical protein
LLSHSEIDDLARTLWFIIADEDRKLDDPALIDTLIDIGLITVIGREEPDYYVNLNLTADERSEISAAIDESVRSGTYGGSYATRVSGLVGKPTRLLIWPYLRGAPPDGFLRDGSRPALTAPTRSSTRSDAMPYDPNLDIGQRVGADPRQRERAGHAINRATDHINDVLNEVGPPPERLGLDLRAPLIPQDAR